MNLTLFIFVLTFLINSTWCGKFKNPRLFLLRKCQRQARKSNCDSLDCFKDDVEECFKKNLGDDWKKTFLPEGLSEKYNLDDIVECQASSLFQCSDRKCGRKTLQKCLVEKLGTEFVEDFMKCKGKVNKNEGDEEVKADGNEHEGNKKNEEKKDEENSEKNEEGTESTNDH